MTVQQKLAIATALSVAIAVALFARRPPPAARTPAVGFISPVSAGMAVVAISLLLVGLVSQTLLRHVVQIAPLVLGAVVAGRSAGRAHAAAPLFAFWLLVMIGIWLFLLGIARVFPGRYTPAEIALTIVIAVASLAGLTTIYRHRSPVPLFARLPLIAAFGLLQYAAMWLSIQLSISR